MAYFHQQSKFGMASTTNGPNNNTMDVSPELHIKMSKKIAQLTKVIYALNTKNDEHEAGLQNMKETHEEEMQQVLMETKKKLNHFQAQLSQEKKLRQRIKDLETALAGQEQHRQSALAEFADFKKNAEEKESMLKAEQSQKILSLSEDLLDVKRNFEFKLNQFEKTKEVLEAERVKQLKELEEKYQHELEILKRSQEDHQSGSLEERRKLEEKFGEEISRLKSENDKLCLQRDELSKDYDAKLEKLQAFHERELAALRDGEAEKQSKNWKEREQALKEEFSEKERNLLKKLDDFKIQVSVVEDELEAYKEKLNGAEEKLSSQASQFQTMKEQMRTSRDEASRSMIKLKEVEGELAAARTRCEEQAQELVKKSGLLGSLEATKLSNEAAIQDHKAALAKLEDKISWMEAERKSLESSQQSLSQEQSHQLKSLEKALEDMSIEKQVMKERFERELAALRTSGSDVETKLVEEHQKEMKELQERLEKERKEEKNKREDEMKKLQEELEKTLDETTTQLTQERDSVKEQLEKLRDELTTKLKRAEDDARKLSNILQERDQGLGSANSHIDNLQKNNSQLKTEIDLMQKELREANKEVLSLKSSLEKAKHRLATEVAAITEESTKKLETLSSDLDEKWTETLRRECEKLRQELTDQHLEDKNAAIEQLSILKDQEMGEARQGWQQKVTELLKEISQLQANLSSKSDSAKAEVADLQRRTDSEINKLKFDLAAAIENHQREIQVLQKSLEDEKENLSQKHKEEMMQLEAKLTRLHDEAITNQIEEHKRSVKALQLEAEESRRAEIDVRLMEHKRSLDKLRLELTQRHSAEMDQLTRAHKTQMAAARMELERAIELKQQQERADKSRMEELQDDVTQRDRHISKLEEDIQRLKEDISSTKEEIDFKAQEIMRVQTDAERRIRQQKEDLAQSHQQQLDDQSAEHLRETQGMLAEFNRAQDMLKDKISALQIMLEEAEDKYKNRESRDEDLEMIAYLKEMMSEKEQMLSKLNEEKRFFQLELINRETNFNKVFNTQPNVGILNPLSKPKKRGTSDTTRYVSAPNLNTSGMMVSSSTGSSPNNARLEPLPDSPIHDIQLNPKKPLKEPHIAPKPSKGKRFINT